MLDAVYLLCIAPVEFLMRLAFDAGMGWFQSAGLAIIFMSLAVSTAILPIYNKAEAWQEEERALKRRFAKDEAAIRAVFRGQERFALLATLYRQQGYSRRMALRSSVGFLLQIPFFFAAYHLLSNMAELRGQAFGPLSDLGAPDGLLALGGCHINVLPLIMTALSLVSAFVYARQLSRRDKIQLYILSGVFLVALYKSPAALTLYWTLNNAYSLGKNIVGKSLLPAWRARSEKAARPEAAGMGVRAVQFTLGAVERLCPPNRLAWALLAAAVVIVEILCQSNICELSTRTIALLGLEIFSFWPLTGIVLRMGKLRDCCPRAAFFAVAVTLCFAIALVFKMYYCIANNNYITPWGLLRVWFAIAMFWILMILTQKVKLYFGTNDIHEHSILSYYAWIMLCMLYFIAVPIAVYISDIQAIQKPFYIMLPELEAYGLVTFLIGVFIIRILIRDIGITVAFLTASAALGCLGYAFIFTGNYGALNGLFLDHPQYLKASGNGWRDAAILLTTCGMVAGLLLCRKAVWLRKACAVLSLALLVGAVWQIASCADEEQQKVAMYKSGRDRERILLTSPPSDLIPAYNVPLLEFSSTEKNLLIIVLDMFTGDHFPALLEEYPELKEAFAGFVWYPDTLTAGSATVWGLNPIHGGAHYAMWNINERRDGFVSAQTAKSHALLPGLLAPLGFECSLAGIQLTSSEAVKKELPEGVEACVDRMNFFRDYAYYWRALYNKFYLKEASNADFLLALSLFKCSPYSWRDWIYQDGKWHLDKSSEVKLNTANTIEAFGALDSLDRVASARAKQATYKYLYFFSTHVGTIFSSTTGLPMSTGQRPRPDAQWRQKYPVIDYLHFVSEWTSLRSLGRFFAWMKENGVWDNTRIIVASDHGWFDSPGLYECFGRVPVEMSQVGLYTGTTVPGRSSALLLFKDFNASGDLTISSEYMSNTDVPEMLVEGIATLEPDLRSGYELRARPDRKRLYFTAFWMADRDRPCVPGRILQVTGSMFNKENWELLREELCQ